MNKGLKSYTKQLKQQVGNAGTAYVNVNENDANMHFILPLVKTVGLAPFEVNLVYTHQNRNEADSLFGNGFKLDVYSELGAHDDDIWITNADGTRDEYTEGKFNPVTQLKLKKCYDNYGVVTDYCAEDKYGNKTYYSTIVKGYPDSIEKKNNCKIMFNLDSSGGYISNKKGDIVTFTKANSTGLIEKIVYEHNGKTLLTVIITYSSDKRINLITYKNINGAEISKTEIIYSSNCVTLKDIVSVKSVMFGYSGNKINSLTDNGGRTTNISYSGNRTTVTDFMGNKSHFIFDKNDMPRYEIVVDKDQSNYVFTETNYDKNTKQLLSQSAPININSENLFTKKISDFNKLSTSITFSNAGSTDSLFSKVLGGTVSKVTGTGLISYNIPRNVIATDTVTAAIFGKLIKGKATFSIYAGKSSETREFTSCGSSNFDLLTVGVNTEQSYERISITILLQDAEIDLGGLRVLKKNFGAFYQYDGNGNTTQAGNMGSTEYTYNSSNLPSRSIGVDSTMVDYDYDGKGNLTKAITAYGVTIDNTYNLNNNPLKCTITNTDKQIMETKKTYTDDGFVKTETDELGNVTSYEYCEDGNIKKVTDALGAVTQLNYHDNGLIKELITSKGSESAKAAYEYNSKNLLQKVTLANGSVYNFTYTDQNWLEEVKLNNKSVFRFLYDNKTGNITEQIYGSGDSFVFSYNLDGNITEVKHRARKNATPTAKYSYTYNSLKQLSNIKDANGKIIRSFVYDSDGRVKTVKENNATISVGYDNLGNVNKQSFSLDDETVDQSFDTVQRSKGSHPESISAAFNKNNYVATFAKDANILCDITGFEPTGNVTLSKSGIIPCARVTASKPLRYALEKVPPMHARECDCVMFWFKPDSPFSTYYLLNITPATGKSWINVEVRAGYVYLTVCDSTGKSTQLLKSDKAVKSGWNFVALNAYTRSDEGATAVTEYSITLNAQTQVYQKTGSVIDVNLPANTKFCICSDTSDSNYNMSGYITALCIAPRTYLSLDHIDKYYRLTKDYIIDNQYVDGAIKTVDFGQATVYNIHSTTRKKFDICPLHNSVTTLDGVAPYKFDLRRSSELDKDRTFNFNGKIKRYAYVADGSMLQYDFANKAEGTVMMRAYTETRLNKQYLLEGIDSRDRRMGLYRGADGYLYIDNDGQILKTSLNFSIGTWHTVGISYKTETVMQGYSSISQTMFRVYLDGSTYNVTGKAVNFDSVLITVGRKTYGLKTYYSMGEFVEYYPLYGQIEMLAVNRVFNEFSTIQTLANELNVFSRTTEYDELGMLKKVDLHKAGDTKLSHTYTYKKRSSTSSYISGLVEKESINYGATTASRSYTYDALGRVTNITDAQFGSHNYTYDYRGFIKTADWESFSYDKNGNITKNGSVTLEYKDADGIKDRLTSVGGQKVYYECAESLNPTMWNGRSYDYEGRRLRAFTYNGTITNYTYDDQCHRIKKVVGGKTTNYYYSGDLLVCEDGPNGRLDFLYDENGQLYGFIKDNSSKYFYIKDILGTILGIVDEIGTIKAKYSYKAFGECTITQNTNNIATINPFRFKGYYYDNESGMYYCQTRYYVPEWGRWLNADNVNYLKFDNINGMNLFAYCANNPIMYADPTGTSFILSFLIAVAVGAVLGGIVGGVTAEAKGDSFASGFLSGALIGGALGGALILGGASMLAIGGKTVSGFFVASTFATKAALLGGTAAISTITTAAAGMGAYAIKESMNGREVDPNEMFRQGISTGLKGALAYATGMALATTGVYNYLLEGVKWTFEQTFNMMLIRSTVSFMFQSPWKILIK